MGDGSGVQRKIQKDKHTIRRHMQIPQEIIRQRLPDIRPVQLQRHKHDARPYHDTPVNLADESVLLTPCPALEGVKPMDVFPLHPSRCQQLTIQQKQDKNKGTNSPVRPRLVLLRRIWVVKHGNLRGDGSGIV